MRLAHEQTVLTLGPARDGGLVVTLYDEEGSVEIVLAPDEADLVEAYVAARRNRHRPTEGG